MFTLSTSIRLKLAVAFLLLGAAIIIAVTISSYIHMRKTLLDQVEKQGVDGNQAGYTDYSVYRFQRVDR